MRKNSNSSRYYSRRSRSPVKDSYSEYSKSSETYRIRLKNLDTSYATKEKLTKIFERYGPVKNAEIFSNYGYVIFANKKDMWKAISEENDRFIGKKKVKIRRHTDDSGFRDEVDRRKRIRYDDTYRDRYERNRDRRSSRYSERNENRPSHSRTRRYGSDLNDDKVYDKKKEKYDSKPTKIQEKLQNKSTTNILIENKNSIAQNRKDNTNLVSLENKSKGELSEQTPTGRKKRKYEGTKFYDSDEYKSILKYNPLVCKIFQLRKNLFEKRLQRLKMNFITKYLEKDIEGSQQKSKKT